MIIAGKKLDLITLDFETYYETGAKDAYSLRNQKMNTSEYIRDKRFYAQCVGVKKNAGKTVVYPHDQIAGAFAAIDWTKSAMLCHNTYFDGFICSHHYNVHPAFYLDTMCMSRAVHGANRSHGLDHLAKLHGLPGKVHGSALVNVAGIREPSKEQLKALSVYCKGDVEDTYALFNLLHEYVPDSELRLIDLTLRMFCRPRMLADIPRLTAEYEREVAEKGEALQRVEEHCTLKQLTSNDQFAELLRAEGIDPPMKPSPADPTKLTYAFAKNDLDFIELMEQGPPAVQALCEARVRNKTAINETRALRLLKAGEHKQAVPVMLNYCGAHTFRWSGGNKLNLQNLPRGGELRRSLLAPKGSVLVVADSAQIEARTLAWLAGETQVVQAFASGQDVYKLMAALIYNIPVDQVDKTQRFVGKLCTLGLGYGMGHAKFRDTLAKGAMGPAVDISAAESKRIVDAYRNTNWKITQLWRRAEAILIDMVLGTSGEYGPLKWGKGYIQMPNGLFMQYKDLTGEIYEDRTGTPRINDAWYSGKRDTKTYIYGGLAVENWVQSLARCIVAEQMLTIAERYEVVTMSHDEIVVIAPKRDAKKCEKFMVNVMSTPPSWAEGLPLGAEAGYDVCYSK